MPDVAGGIETHCQNLYPRLNKIDPMIDVVLYGRVPYVPEEQKSWEGIKIVPLRTVRNRHLETLQHTFLSVLRARFKERADLLHIHAIGPGVFAPLARLLGLRVVVTHHGQDYKRLKWNFAGRVVLRAGETLSMLFAHQVIAVAESNAALLKKRFPFRAGIVQFIPNGAAIGNGETVGPSILEELSLVPKKFVIAVGRLEPGKGLQDLVSAFKATRTDRKLVVVGGINHSDDFSKSLLAEASDRVIFAGHRSGAELATLYRNAALFVQSSYHEGLPIVALEALHADLPIVLSDIRPHLDLSLPASNYFPVGDCNRLARCLEESDYEKFRVDARKILRKYDWDDIAQQTHTAVADLFLEDMRQQPG